MPAAGRKEINALAVNCISHGTAYSGQGYDLFNNISRQPMPSRVSHVIEEEIVLNKNQLPTWILVLIFFTGCASVPTADIKVSAQVDPKANFSGYQTYAWLGAAAIVNDPYGQWEPPQFDADAEIIFLIDRELRKRGMSENTTNPDVIVAFAAGIDMDALGLKADPKTESDLLENVPQGGLAVLLADSETGFVVWVGTATAELQENPDTKTVKARLDYAVKEMFKKLPR
jgi:hypothetical protein